tara:strand:- start:153 stop:1067 length:915 start_codon:yes stop_codon:yes gene_type:complete
VDDIVKHYLTVATSIRTKYPNNVIQWFLWNKFIGVDYFYIVDDNSDSEISEILKRHLDSVTVIPIQEIGKEASQVDLYQHLYEEYKNASKWMMFIDDDEFIFPSSSNLNFSNFLKKFENARGVELNWRNFSPQAQRENPSGDKLILDFYKFYKPSPYPKSAINCDKVKHLDVQSTLSVHRPIRDGVVIASGDDVIWEIAPSQKTEPFEDDLPFCIHHYQVKSLDEAIYKISERKCISERTKIQNGQEKEKVRFHSYNRYLESFFNWTDPEGLAKGDVKRFDFLSEHPCLRNNFITFCKENGYNF